NYFRQGWVVARLEKTLKAAFGTDPMVMMLPHQDKVEPDATFGAFTIFLSGADSALAPLRKAFSEHGDYWLDAENAAPASPRNGFIDKPAGTTAADGTAVPAKDDERWMRFGLASITPPED